MASLFLTFFRIGCVGFGGLGSVLALIERELVTRRRALTAEDVTEALTYTKLLPGSTVVQVVSYLGYRLGGWRGAALATVAFIAPAFIVMLALSIAYTRLAGIPNVQGALKGLSAAVVGLLLITCYRLGRSTVKNWVGLVLAIAAFVLAVIFHVPLALIVIGSGLLGMIVYRSEEEPET